jgi:hypothetical protein
VASGPLARTFGRRGEARRRGAWVELPRHRYDKVWDRFDEAFGFRPSASPEGWPSFREPAPPATWRIADLSAEFSPCRDPRAPAAR